MSTDPTRFSAAHRRARARGNKVRKTTKATEFRAPMKSLRLHPGVEGDRPAVEGARRAVLSMNTLRLHAQSSFSLGFVYLTATFSHLLALHSKILSTLVILSTEPLYPCRLALVRRI